MSTLGSSPAPPTSLPLLIPNNTPQAHMVTHPSSRQCCWTCPRPPTGSTWQPCPPAKRRDAH
eukprot:6458106-Alexandrium_andersonii.AAC.1